MKVKVDKDICTGCGLCADNCPDVFEMENDTSTVKVSIVPQNLVNAVKEAASNCPVEAIIIEE